MKFTIQMPRPRNPVVPAMRSRRGGLHRAGNRTDRQRAFQALRRDLREMKHSP